VEKPRHSMLGNIKYFHVKRKLLRGYELVTLLPEALVRPCILIGTAYEPKKRSDPIAANIPSTTSSIWVCMQSERKNRKTEVRG